MHTHKLTGRLAHFACSALRAALCAHSVQGLKEGELGFVGEDKWGKRPATKLGGEGATFNLEVSKSPM